MNGSHQNNRTRFREHSPEAAVRSAVDKNTIMHSAVCYFSSSNFYKPVLGENGGIFKLINYTNVRLVLVYWGHVSTAWEL